MAGINWTPERCYNEGQVYNCRSLPDARAGADEAARKNDVTILRGLCPNGYHYEHGQNCVPD
jgi:hypothetical protein